MAWDWPWWRQKNCLFPFQKQIVHLSPTTCLDTIWLRIVGNFKQALVRCLPYRSVNWRHWISRKPSLECRTHTCPAAGREGGGTYISGSSHWEHPIPFLASPVRVKKRSQFETLEGFYQSMLSKLWSFRLCWTATFITQELSTHRNTQNKARRQLTYWWLKLGGR